ncbi:hypothetical protein KFE25_014002 [Diacronema lutheri]|uniref:Uncharacterized protein n=3 Tax=Diacronema lutheri TaxID=2081491 RepID=A0A8J5XDU8_DIALT|nr:hypothetical protein KFE25_014002 [Diacronema lutheri]
MERQLHLCGHKARVFGLSWRPLRDEHTRILASASEDQSVIIWRVAAAHGMAPSYRKAHVLADAHASEVLRCAWSPTGRLLATGGADGAARVFAMPDDDVLSTPPIERARLSTTADGAVGAAGAGASDDSQVYGLAFGGTDARLLVAAGSSLLACDVEAGRSACAVSLAAASPSSGDYVFGGQRNEASESFIFDLALSADGTLVALACSTGRAHVFDARLRSTGAGVTLGVTDGDYVSACAFALPLACAPDEPAVRAAASGAPAAPPILFTACGSGACAWWDVRYPFAPFARVTPHDGAAYSCTPLGCGRVASVGRDKRVMLHQLAAGMRVGGADETDGVPPDAQVLQLPDRGLCCAGQGRMLAAAGGSGGLVNDTAVHVWLLGDDALPPPAERRIGESVTTADVRIGIADLAV